MSLRKKFKNIIIIFIINYKMNCNICTEKFNKTKRFKITCNVCNFEACRECYKQYISNEKTETKCMSCKTVFPINYILENFEKKYIKTEYKEHLKNILFEKELGMMQATQPAVENEIKKEQLNEEIAELSIAMEKIKQQLNEKKRELYSIKYKKIEDCIKEKRKFIRKCPKDNCKGFLSTALKCEICGYYSCKDCILFKC
jgi:hypothetical protein